MIFTKHRQPVQHIVMILLEMGTEFTPKMSIEVVTSLSLMLLENMGRYAHG